MLTTVAAVAALVVPTSVAVAATSPDPDHPLLVEARRNVEEATDELAAAREDREAAAAALAGVDARLEEVEQSVNDAAAAVEEQRQEVAAAEQRLGELRDEAAALQDRIERRTVELYMNGGDDGISTVLSSGDVRDAADRSSFIDLVATDDNASLEEATASRRALEGAAERFDVETARLEQMRASQEALLVEVRELRETRAAALGRAEGDVADLAAVEDDLSEDYDRVAELIATGTATRMAAAAPSSAGYGWPTCTRMTSGFGYRWGRLHKGIDLGGNVGDPIAAARAGTVVFAGSQGAYGNLVLVDHGDGVVTAYAHQSQMLVSVGQSVARGELIGQVGNTGRSTGPHLHFEIRVNGAAVDPVQYLPGGC